MVKNLDTAASILVTGGTGFVGSHLVEALVAKGFTNIAVTSFSARDEAWRVKGQEIEVFPVDLTDQAATFGLLEKYKPQYLYHLAAYAEVGESFEQASTVLHTNLTIQLNMLEAIRRFIPQSRILIIGSGMEYDVMTLPEMRQPIKESHPLGPVSPYGVSKVVQDLLSLSYSYAYDLDVIRARPFNHIGERQTPAFAVANFAKQIVAIERGQQQELKVGNLDAVRDFTDVKDVCQAYILLMTKGLKQEVYNIGSGKGLKMSDVLDQMCRLATIQVPVVTDPDKLRPLDVPIVIADNEKITALGWRPHISLAETLARILAYWREAS
jgi:GDP-4-dehydro-6-deoxy-D-mannose reductase